MTSQKPYYIEPVVDKDMPLLLKLNNNAAPAVNELTVDKFNILCQKSELLIKAVTEKGPCGFLMVLPSGLNYKSLNYQWFSKAYSSFLYIDRIIVCPEEAQTGIGTAMYRHLFEHARKTGWNRINCEVNIRPKNESSLYFHKKLGFHPLGTQETEGGTKTVQFYTRTIDF